jgi:hypothetical protein
VHLAVDERAARRVAAHFLDGEGATDALLVRAAYLELVRQTDDLLRQVMWCWPALRVALSNVRVPYDSDHELIDSVRTTQVIEIPQASDKPGHACLGCAPGGDYDRFRVLHDVVGHVLPGFGFDRDGEFCAWQLQHRQYRGLARWALATELHAQHCVLWTTGELAEPKPMLLDRRVLRASMSAATAA